MMSRVVDFVLHTLGWSAVQAGAARAKRQRRASASTLLSGLRELRHAVDVPGDLVGTVAIVGATSQGAQHFIQRRLGKSGCHGIRPAIRLPSLDFRLPSSHVQVSKPREKHRRPSELVVFDDTRALFTR
jgi:hypothetical protein